MEAPRPDKLRKEKPKSPDRTGSSRRVAGAFDLVPADQLITVNDVVQIDSLERIHRIRLSKIVGASSILTVGGGRWTIESGTATLTSYFVVIAGTYRWSATLSKRRVRGASRHCWFCVSVSCPPVVATAASFLFACAGRTPNSGKDLAASHRVLRTTHPSCPISSHTFSSSSHPHEPHDLYLFLIHRPNDSEPRPSTPPSPIAIYQRLRRPQPSANHSGNSPVFARARPWSPTPQNTPPSRPSSHNTDDWLRRKVFEVLKTVEAVPERDNPSSATPPDLLSPP